jgi:hypothetical protein
MSLSQTDEEMIFGDEVSDEAVEAAFVAPRGLPTLMHNTYCFACPSLQSVAKLLSKSEALRIARFLPLATKIDQ